MSVCGGDTCVACQVAARWSPELRQADLEAVQQDHYRERRLRHRKRRDVAGGGGGARQDWQRDGDGDSERLRQVGCRAARRRQLGQAGGLPCSPGRGIEPSSNTIADGSDSSLVVRVSLCCAATRLAHSRAHSGAVRVAESRMHVMPITTTAASLGWAIASSHAGLS